MAINIRYHLLTSSDLFQFFKNLSSNWKTLQQNLLVSTPFCWKGGFSKIKIESNKSTDVDVFFATVDLYLIAQKKYL